MNTHLDTHFLQFCKGKERAVVLKDTAAVFEPRQDAETHFSLYEGNIVKVLKAEEEGGWRKVERFDGKAGWVRADVVNQVTGVSKK